MSTPWGELYKELEKYEGENPDEKVRKNPHHPEHTGELTESEKIYLKAQMKTWDLLQRRRGYSGYRQVIFKMFDDRKKPKEVYIESKSRYVFLQYTPIIFKWLRAKLKIKQDDLDFLLYAYPVGPISKYEIGLLVDALDIKIKTKTLINKLRDKNLLKIGYNTHTNDKGERVPNLYVLTSKAKFAISYAHQLATGESRIKETYNNPIYSKKISDVFRKMNERLVEE